MGGVYTFVLLVHGLLASCLIGVVLLQKSEGGALGIGGGPSGFMTARGAANLLTRLTSIFATLFVVTSLTLAALAAGSGKAAEARAKRIEAESQKQSQTGPSAPARPSAPEAPKVPAAQ